MAYRTLAKEFHSSPHDSAQSRVDALYRQRLQHVSTINTGIDVGGYPVFCVVDAEVTSRYTRKPRTSRTGRMSSNAVRDRCAGTYARFSSMGLREST